MDKKFYKIVYHVNQGYGDIDKQTFACVYDSKENVRQFIDDINKKKRCDYVHDYYSYAEMFTTLEDLRKTYLGE